jgi:dTDP-4-dehydrorhamnose 3,5-epimerase
MSIHTNVVASNQELPVGVALRNLHGHLDFRGRFTEVFRREWNTGVDPVQWNVVSSATRVLRGVHVHRQHSDYFILLSGCASIGLRDLRRSSRSAGLAAVVELRSDVLQALTIPPGVAHGFYFHEPSIHLYSVSRYFDPTDELGCHWSDPALEIPWQPTDPVVSERDASAPPLSALLDQLAAGPPS